MLLSDEIPDPRDIALISLADACGALPDILTRQQFRDSRDRIGQFRKMDLVGREVAVAEIERTVLRTVRARSAQFRKLLLALSVVVGLAAVATLLAPRFPIEGSFRPGLLERLWFDGVWQQWSGYALLALSGAGLVTALLTKLRKVVRKTGYNGWRIAHASLGVACLVTLFGHTGFRLGINLNAALMTCYVAALTCGALAGVSINGALLLRRLHIPSRLRTLPVRLHVLALVPLPALLIVHVLVVYLY